MAEQVAKYHDIHKSNQNGTSMNLTTRPWRPALCKMAEETMGEDFDIRGTIGLVQSVLSISRVNVPFISNYSDTCDETRYRLVKYAG